MNTLERIFPLAVVLILGAWLYGKSMPAKPSPGGVDFAAVGRLPVLEGGRVMPFDALARTSLQSISGITEVKNEQGEFVAGANEWLVNIFDNPNADAGKAADYKIFRIEHDQVLGTLDLPRRPGFYRYSWKELMRSREKLQEEFEKINEKRDQGKKLDLYDSKVQDLGNKIEQFMRLLQTRGRRPDSEIFPVPPQSAGDKWQSLTDVDKLAVATLSDAEIDELQERVGKEIFDRFTKLYGDLSKMAEPGQRMIQQEIKREFTRARMQEGRARRASVSPPAAAFTQILQSARADKGEATAQAVEKYTAEYLGQVPDEDRYKNRLEAKWLGHFAPFYHLTFLYLTQVILTLVAWLIWTRPLNRGALWLGVLTFAVHSAALVLRMYVQGRPPVTNLYASAVFIGWGAVGLALLLEGYYKNGVGNLVAATVGASTLELAHFLGGSGDTMAMLVAVLDTNFWLATHVTTVTLGYTATLVSGMIATLWVVRMLLTVVTTQLRPARDNSPRGYLVYLWAALGLGLIVFAVTYLAATMVERYASPNAAVGALLEYASWGAGLAVFAGLAVLRFTATDDTPAAGGFMANLSRQGLTDETNKTLGQMIYGVTCFATLLSFVGTVLGGIWADYSWGRFWGWDPKENGAVLIVIWNALILHARWGGLVQVRGMAILAIFGNIVTAWSWFGTNQLGIGLHAYGFDNRLANGCRWFWFSQLALMAIGLVPREFWRGPAKARTAAPAEPTPEPALNGADQSGGRKAKRKNR